MSDLTSIAKNEIFASQIESVDEQSIKHFISNQKHNSALTQQLALDASKLIITAEDRLGKQHNTGFFKRVTSIISGKSNENQLLNQKDMIHMQKCAWYYLQELQRQNLIKAESIGIIKNNLSVMNDYAIETRDFLDQAISKISDRLKNIENKINFNDWMINIKANRRRLKSNSKNVLILHLTYDFIRHHGQILIQNDIKYLISALQELDIDCDDEIELLDFIIDLIYEIDSRGGIERYKSIIQISFENHTIEPRFINDNIASIGFNAIYFLLEEYEKIISITQGDHLSNTDDAQKKIISKFFGNEFDNLSAKYTIHDFIVELISGYLLTKNIYEEQNGLNVVEDQFAEELIHEPVSLTPSLPKIEAHSFLDKNEDEQSKNLYLKSFGLCLKNSSLLGKSGVEFITLLSEKAQYPQLLEDMIQLSDNPNKYTYLPNLQQLLDSQDKIYTWLFDVFFLLKIDGNKFETIEVVQALKALKPINFKENYPNIRLILNEDNENKIIDAGSEISKYTKGWMNVVSYRELTFNSYYQDIINELMSIADDYTKIGAENLKRVMKNASNFQDTIFMGYVPNEDDSFMVKMGAKAAASVCESNRSSCLSELNESRKRTLNFISNKRNVLRNANGMIGLFGIEKINIPNISSITDDFSLDNSFDNDDWHDQFSTFEQKIDDLLESFMRGCNDAICQINIFIKGKFDQSIIELRNAERAAFLLKKEQEELRKRSISFVKDNKNYTFAIDWKKVENTPFEPEKIRDIKTNGKVWLILNNHDKLYRSDDGVSWVLIDIDISESIKEIYFINETWIIVSGYYKKYLHYSVDLLNWGIIELEIENKDFSRSLSLTNEILYFNGLWLWKAEKRKEYEYKEKGLFFDSKKTSYYEKTLFLCSDSLNGEWRFWDKNPGFPEGVVIEYVRSIPEKSLLLTFCKYDYFYISNKKKNTHESFVAYLIPDKDWRLCTWDGKNEYYSPLIVRMIDKLVCLNSNNLLISDKGYKWENKDIDINMSVDDFICLNGFGIFFSKHGRIYFTQDVEVFNELTLEKGSWSDLSFNEIGTLAVFSPDGHETFLMVGSYKLNVEN